MASLNKEYKGLPPAIVAALHTNRGELVKHLRGLTQEQVPVVLDLLGDLIEDRYEARRREKEYAHRLNEISRTLTGFSGAIDRLSEQANFYREED